MGQDLSKTNPCGLKYIGGTLGLARAGVNRKSTQKMSPDRDFLYYYCCNTVFSASFGKFGGFGWLDHYWPFNPPWYQSCNKTLGAGVWPW